MKTLKSHTSLLYNRYFCLFIVLIAVLIISCTEKEEIPIVKANSTQTTIKIDGKKYSGNWTISPDIPIDIFPVELYSGQTSEIIFYTDIDSITFLINSEKKKDFIVVLNERDSAYTSFRATKPAVTFTDDYVKNNRGKWSIEVPEVQELLLHIFAITPTGLADVRSRIINHDTTDYYLDVIKYFSKFKEDLIVHKMDSLIKKNWFINLKADANAYVFNSENKIVKSSTYDRMRGSSNLLEPYEKLLNDFAEKSNFRSFYNSHKALYDSLITWQKTAFSTEKQWAWLEKQFPDHSYDNYRITFSPLVKGNHSTVRFNKNGFKQAIMFIAPPYRVKNVNKNVSQGLVTRIVFTEIDHNYVNPETDKYIKQINQVFKDRKKWTNGKESKGYNSPYTVFNEYMTWSVYLLYCYDTYNKEDFEVINKRIVNYKINRRGFQQFGQFNEALLRLYRNKTSNQTIADLYPSLLDWAASYKP